MSPARDDPRPERVRQLFDAALDIETRRRGAFLAEACGGDEQLRAEVEELLRALESAHTADLLPGLARPSTRPRAQTASRNGGSSSAGGEARARASSLTGRLVANYRIEEELARGGMGVVYRAQHVLLQRQAAVKVLHDHLCGDRGLVQRLLNEARAVNAIRNPNIVELLDAGLLGGDDGAPYIVMELLDGESLGARLQRSGPLPARTAATIGLEIAAALAVAHDHAIVHRDLKPENVFLARRAASAGLGLAPDTQVKVLDFGIAKLRGEASAASVATQEGGLLGTPQYMAPEQWRDPRSGDRRIDVYALGLILFEMMTGEPPFRGAAWGELFEMHVSQPPPRLRERVPDAPAALEDLVGKALAKNPDHRFPSMRAIAAALAAAVPEAVAPAGLLDGPRSAAGLDRRATADGATAPAATPRRRTGTKIAALVVGVLAAGGLGAGALAWSRKPPAVSTPAAAAAPPPTAPVAAAPQPSPAPPPAPAPTVAVPAPAPVAPAPAAPVAPAAAPHRRRGTRRGAAPADTPPAAPDTDAVPSFLKQNPYN